jgi:hypothetical protein
MVFTERKFKIILKELQWARESILAKTCYKFQKITGEIIIPIDYHQNNKETT